MKKLIIIVIALCSVSLCDAEVIMASNTSYSIAETQQSVVFRRTQRLRSNNGRSIYFYTNRKCEMYDGNRLVAEYTYTIQNGEVHLRDSDGITIHKGRYVMNRDRINLHSLSIAGTTYYAY